MVLRRIGLVMVAILAVGCTTAGNQIDDPALATLDCVGQRHELAGRILDAATGEPIAGARIEITSIQTEFRCYEVVGLPDNSLLDEPLVLTTNADGELFVFAEDMLSITIEAAGCEPLIFSPTDGAAFSQTPEQFLYCGDPTES